MIFFNDSVSTDVWSLANLNIDQLNKKSLSCDFYFFLVFIWFNYLSYIIAVTTARNHMFNFIDVVHL